MHFIPEGQPRCGSRYTYCCKRPSRLVGVLMSRGKWGNRNLDLCIYILFHARSLIDDYDLKIS